MRRSIVAGGMAVVVLGATGAGWFAASRVKSPAQIAAKTAPPEASLITYPVEKRVLSSDLIVRGTVRYSDPISVTLAPSLLRPGTPLVSSPPKKSTKLSEGDVALVVSGRPVFAVVGASPGYRDLGPGTSGVDVQQLETMLAQKGFDPGPVDGVFDAATSSAVAAWYRSAGFAPFGATDAQLTALRQAQSALSQATDRLLLARQNELVNRKGVKPADIADAKAAIVAADAAIVSAQSITERDAFRGQADIGLRQSALDTANVALEDAQRRVDLAAQGRNVITGLPPAIQIPQYETAVSDNAIAVNSAETELASSRAVAEAVRKAGESAIADGNAKLLAAGTFTGELTAQGSIDLLNAVLAAKASLSAAEAASGKDNSVAAADVVTKSNLLTQARSRLALAQRQLATAKTGIDPQTGVSATAVTPGELSSAATALKQAQIARDTAVADLAAMKQTVSLTANADTFALADARTRAAAARARLAALSTPGVGGATLATAVKVAETEQTRLKNELAKIVRLADVQVPANEIVFFPSLPLRIDDTKVKRGDVATGEVMTVSGTRLAIDSALLTTEAPLTRLDAPVQIEAPEFAYSSGGHIAFLADKPGLRNTDAQHIAIEVTPDDAPLQLVGASVRLTIPTKTTNGEALVVPISALSVRSDGSTQLQVERSIGNVSTVVVSAGLSAQGFVEVTPITGSLTAGDRVVIGAKGTTTATPGPLDSPTSLSPATVSPSPTSGNSAPSETLLVQNPA